MQNSRNKSFKKSGAEKETDIQRTICDYLQLKNYFFWRTNTTPIYDPTRKAFRAMPKYALKGVPDIILVLDGVFVGLEVKTRSGRQSEQQKEFEKKLKNSGGKYYVVRSVEDVIEIGL